MKEREGRMWFNYIFIINIKYSFKWEKNKCLKSNNKNTIVLNVIPCHCQWDQDLSLIPVLAFGTRYLWRIIMLSLDIVGKFLVLPQITVLYFVDSLWEALISLRSWCSIRWGEMEGAGGGEGCELGFLCKICKDSVS